MRSDLVFAWHAYIPKQTTTLTKYYRNLVNIERVICVLNIRISCKLARI